MLLVLLLVTGSVIPPVDIVLWITIMDAFECNNGCEQVRAAQHKLVFSLCVVANHGQ